MTILTLCVAPGCAKPIPLGQNRCVAHRQELDRGDNRRRHAKSKRNGLKSQHWQRIRKTRLAIDHGRCTIRTAGCTGEATTVHLDPRLRGNHALATLENTRSACAHCHGVIDGGRARGRAA